MLKLLWLDDRGVAHEVASGERIKAQLNRSIKFCLRQEVSSFDDSQNGQRYQDVAHPQVEGCALQGSWQSQNLSSTIKFFNGQMVRSSETVDQMYSYLPTKEGACKLGQFKVTLSDGTIWTSPNIVLDVQQAEEGSSQPCTLALESETTTPFVWQPFKVRARLCAKQNEVMQASRLSLIAPDFQVQQQGDGREYPMLIDDQAYQIYEVDFMVTPTKPGLHEIPSVTIDYVAVKPNNLIDTHFFGIIHATSERYQGRVVSNRLQVEVKDLPAGSNKLRGIGNFTNLSLSIGQHACLADEPLTCKLTLEGEGNFVQITNLPLVLTEGMRAHFVKADWQPASTAPDSITLGRKTFEYIVQISQPGEISVPSQEFVFFDPQSATYQTLKSQPFSIQVVGNAQVQPVLPAVVSASPVKEPAASSIVKAEPTKAIVPVQGNIDPIGQANDGLGAGVYLGLLVGLVMPLLILLMYKRWRAWRKHKYCYHIALVALQEIKNSKDLVLINNVLRTYLAERFQVELDQVTGFWLESRLKQTVMSETKCRQLLDFMAECLALEFSRDHQRLQQGHGDDLLMVQKAITWLMYLEHEGLFFGEQKQGDGNDSI